MFKTIAAVFIAALPLSPLAAAADVKVTKANAGAPISVKVEAAGPDVIMIPGLMSSREVWDGAVASLGGRYRVHRVQLAGFAGEPAAGKAERPVLSQAVEALHDYIERNKIERPMIVGHSIGGLMALMLASRYPEDAGRILVVDALPFYSMMFGPGMTAEAVRPQAAAMRALFETMSDEAFRAQQSATLGSLVKNEAAKPRLLEEWLRSDRKVAAAAVYEAMTTDMRPALPAIKAPVTVAYAVNQVATEQRFGALFRAGYASLPEVRFVPVEDSYHFLMLDQPARFETLLKDFLAGKR